MISQIEIIIFVLLFIAILGFIGSASVRNPNHRVACSAVIFFATCFLFLISITLMTGRDMYRALSKCKCPEYEKIENVYKLKEK